MRAFLIKHEFLIADFDGAFRPNRQTDEATGGDGVKCVSFFVFFFCVYLFEG